MKKCIEIPGQMSFFNGGCGETYVPISTSSLDVNKTSKSIELKENKNYVCSYSRLQELFHEAIRIVEEMGFPLEKIDRTCQINKRYSSRWGTCYHNSRTGNRVEVSQQLLKSGEKNIMTTLIHEVLHATEGCHNHGALWKSRAEKINRKYGYNIKRCTSAEEKGFSKDEIVEKCNYVYRCKKMWWNCHEKSCL